MTDVGRYAEEHSTPPGDVFARLDAETRARFAGNAAFPPLNSPNSPA